MNRPIRFWTPDKEHYLLTNWPPVVNWRNEKLRLQRQEDFQELADALGTTVASVENHYRKIKRRKVAA